MAKPRTAFRCTSCNATHPRWLGKCPDCGSWDALESITLTQTASSPNQSDPAALLSAYTADASSPLADLPTPTATALPNISDNDTAIPRTTTGLPELDRVLGGGIVPGSATLLGGDPGIGKSTLLLQAAAHLATPPSPAKVLYATSEESAHQLRLRAERLNLADASNLFVLADAVLPRIIEQARTVKPTVLIIDSVQLIYTPDLPAAPGSVAQLRRCAAQLVTFAKATDVAVVLVGHVTKDGHLAGPRLLEHLVDTVLSFEGDRYHAHRVVRAIKNRFGSTLELGLFEMTSLGLTDASPDRHALVLDAARDPKPGCAIAPIMTGTRCLLVELQALTATGFLGNAKRKASGIDTNRLAMIIAVLEQHAELRLADADIFAQSVGGIRVAEPAADLALLLAIAGAHLRKALPPNTAAVGEVGLSGDVRPVPNLQARLHEAHTLNLTHIITPPLPKKSSHSIDIPKNLTLLQAKTINQAIAHLT